MYNKLVVPDTAKGYYLKVPEININDYFKVLDSFGAFNPHIFYNGSTIYW